MTTVTVTIATASTKFNSTIATRGIAIAVGGLPPQIVTTAPYTAIFNDVAPGSYSATAQALDTDGGRIGTLVSSDPFTIADPGVMLDIPLSITVSIGA